MGKRAKQSGTEDQVHPLDHPWDPYEAKAAIDSGEEAPIGSYLGRVGEVLKLLADQLDPNDVRCGWQVKPRGIAKPTERESQPPDADLSWESDTRVAKECIENGQAELVGWFLRDVGAFVQYLAEHFDQTSKTQRRLTFVRRKRGKPKNPSKMFRDSKIGMALLFHARKKHARKKKEAKTGKAAVFDVMERQRVSRSTVYRAVGPIRRPKP